MSFEQNLNDRKLGHEWYGWDGNIEAHEAFIREPKRLFLSVVAVAFALLLSLGYLLVWGFAPRLDSIHPSLDTVALGVLLTLIAGFAAIFGTLCYALVAKRPSRAAEGIAHAMFRLFPILSRVSAFLGISKDRLGYSLIEINNELTRNRLRACSNGRILCLAPRCLDKGTVEQIRSMMAEYDCDFYMAPSGAQARQQIVKTKPAGIVGIACERDLVTGIRDVGYRIPVIGIANKRPAGPCKAAFIDLHELREAIEGMKSRLDLEPSCSNTEST